MIIVNKCPFCGTIPEIDSEDFCYPAGHPFLNPETNKYETVWSVNCNEIWGGCSANILGDSKEDCIKKWNRRDNSAENALRVIASYLSIDGYNDEFVDAEKYQKKIINEIDILLNKELQLLNNS